MPPRNLLGQETSPYLLQHADNPVHWQPWGEAALAAASALHRPILLSIGYSACHWCHVMAHESFENPETAALMNELFVCIKVDREERPDVDNLYMTALHALGEQGGWPLTMFLTPHGDPFWGGTYYPPRPAHGRPSFHQVMHAVSNAFHTDADGIARNTEALRGALQQAALADPGPLPDHQAILQMATRIASMTDPIHGGLRGAPRFPNAPLFRFLWLVGRSRRQNTLCEPVLLMLRRMIEGGIHDHLGGGFARYSTDGEWLAPHFEKMLYDNAQLLELLASAHAAEPHPLFAGAAHALTGWLLRDMPAGSPPHAFAAAEDADSEGEEGRFYVWSATQIEALLGPRTAAFAAAYDVTPEGNWEGSTILRLRGGANPDDFAGERALLLAARASRPRPGRDDKVLTDWNGLTIAALCHAAAIFDQPSWLAAARDAYRLLVQTVRRPDGRFDHAWCRGRVTAPGLLEDQSAMALAAIALFEATAERTYLDEAAAIVAVVQTLFAGEDGGFFQTAADATDLPPSLGTRPRVAADNATPSGNGMLAEALAKLFLITGEPQYNALCERLIATFAGNLGASPTLALAAELLLNGATLAVSGNPADAQTRALLEAARRRTDPTICLAALIPHPAVSVVSARPSAHLCRHQTCSQPVHTPADLTALIG